VKEEGTEIAMSTMLHSSTGSVQSITATSTLVDLHNHCTVSSEWFCSGSSHRSTLSALLRAFHIPRKSEEESHTVGVPITSIVT
jgi:hypothetical protein